MRRGTSVGGAGEAGPAGASAYEIWLDNGGVGDVNDYLASLVGPQGPPGEPGADGASGQTLIEEITLAADGTMDFQNIPQTYRSLRLIGNVRAGQSAVDRLRMRFNNSSSNGYAWETSGSAGGSTSGSGSVGGPASADVGTLPGFGAWMTSGAADSVPNAFGVLDVLIPNYRSTVFHKNWIGRMSGPAGTQALAGSFRSEYSAGVWTVNMISPASAVVAISRITLFGLATANLRTGSKVALYGVT
jgi:hypothetical protein